VAVAGLAGSLPAEAADSPHSAVGSAQTAAKHCSASGSSAALVADSAVAAAEYCLPAARTTEQSRSLSSLVDLELMPWAEAVAVDSAEPVVADSVAGTAVCSPAVADKSHWQQVAVEQSNSSLKSSSVLAARHFVPSRRRG